MVNASIGWGTGTLPLTYNLLRTYSSGICLQGKALLPRGIRKAGNVLLCHITVRFVDACEESAGGAEGAGGDEAGGDRITTSSDDEGEAGGDSSTTGVVL